MSEKGENPIEVQEQISSENQENLENQESQEKEEIQENQEETQEEAKVEGEQKEHIKIEEKEESILERRKSDPFGSENFLAKIESKIQENETLQNELVKTKYENLRTDITDYFAKLKENIVKQIDETRDSVLSKVGTIIEKETGFIDWDKFRAELFKRKEEYESCTDIDAQKKAFDAYFQYYNTTMKRVDLANSSAYNTIDSTAKLFKFDEIVLDSFLVKLKSICSVLESDFVTNVSFTANHLDPNKIRLEELVQIPHPGVWLASEKIEKFDVFILGGREGRVSMYDSKTLRVLDVVQGFKSFISCLHYVPQLNYLLIGGADSQVAVRRVEGRNLGKNIANLEAEGYVTFIEYIEDENLIISVGTDPNIRLYHPTSLVTIGKIPTTRPGVKPRGGIHYFKDKKLLLVGFDDGMFHFYSLKTKKLAYAIFVEGTNYWGLEFHAPTQTLYAHTAPNQIKIWDFKGERPVDQNAITLEGEGEKAYHIRIVDNYLFSTSCSEKVIIYDIEKRQMLKKIEIPSMKCEGLLVLEKEGRIIVTDEDSARIASIKLH